jgi:hypothetical protein
MTRSFICNSSTRRPRNSRGELSQFRSEGEHADRVHPRAWSSSTLFERRQVSDRHAGAEDTAGAG